MKIQLSPKRIVQDAVTVWSEPGPEVDVVMDLKNLTFRPGMVDEIYSFHVLDHLFEDEGKQAVKNWYNMLKKNGRLFALVDNFEYIARGFVGGDISIDILNEHHNHPTQYTSDSLFAICRAAGFTEEKIRTWLADEVDGKFHKKHFELVFDAEKI